MKIRKFAMELAQTKLSCVESQVKSCFDAIFCEEFFSETLVCQVLGFHTFRAPPDNFSPNFLMCSICSPSSNLNFKGFRLKIIQYMAAGQDNSSKLGSGLTTRSSTHQN
jgi:hypothetical protein